jgi:hypothetical protein
MRNATTIGVMRRHGIVVPFILSVTFFECRSFLINYKNLFSPAFSRSDSLQRLNPKNDELLVTTSYQIEDLLSRAIIIGSKVRFSNSNITSQIRRPARLTFAASFSRKIVFDDSMRALRYLSQPISNYSVLDSSLVTKISSSDGSDAFSVTLPLGDFTSAISMFTNSALSGRSSLCARTTIYVVSKPEDGCIEMNSGPVYVFHMTTSPSDHHPALNSPHSSSADRTISDIDSQSLPSWLVWGGRNATVEDGNNVGDAFVRMSVQPAIKVKLQWTPNKNITGSGRGIRSLVKRLLSSSNTDNSILDQLLVQAKLSMKMDLSIPLRQDLAAGIIFQPVKLLVQQAGSLVLSTIMHSLAPRFIDLLLKDYTAREL